MSNTKYRVEIHYMGCALDKKCNNKKDAWLIVGIFKGYEGTDSIAVIEVTNETEKLIWHHGELSESEAAEYNFDIPRSW
jgi:hypothetical protein